MLRMPLRHNMLIMAVIGHHGKSFGLGLGTHGSSLADADTRAASEPTS
jgi:hypothetical protein